MGLIEVKIDELLQFRLDMFLKYVKLCQYTTAVSSEKLLVEIIPSFKKAQ